LALLNPRDRAPDNRRSHLAMMLTGSDLAISIFFVAHQLASGITY
jgi:hypothetical protein